MGVVGREAVELESVVAAVEIYAGGQQKAEGKEEGSKTRDKDER